MTGMEKMLVAIAAAKDPDSLPEGYGTDVSYLVEDGWLHYPEPLNMDMPRSTVPKLTPEAEEKIGARIRLALGSARP